MGRIRRSWLPLRGSINQSATKWSSWDKWWTNHPLFGTLIIISPFSPEIIREWCKSNFQKKYQLWQISSVRIHSPVSRNVEQCICTRQDEATSTLPPFPPPSPPPSNLRPCPPRHSAVYLPVTKSPFRENVQFVNDVWSRSHPLKPPLNRNYL